MSRDAAKGSKGEARSAAAPAPDTVRICRAAGFVKPAHWTNDPLPTAAPTQVDEDLSPTRYGDWVKKGIAIDF